MHSVTTVTGPATAVRGQPQLRTGGLTFDDAAFDIAPSNAVIEHLGGWQQMKQFAAQQRRVARHD